MGLLHLLDHEAQNPQIAHFNKTHKNPSFNLWKQQLPFRTKQQQQNQAKHPPKKKKGKPSKQSSNIYKKA